MTENTAGSQVKEDAAAKQTQPENVGDEQPQRPHPLFIKREKPAPNDADKVVKELKDVFAKHQESHPDITAEEAETAIRKALEHSDPNELYKTVQGIDPELLAQDIADTAQKIKDGTYEEPKETKSLTRREEYLQEKDRRNQESGAKYMSDEEHDQYTDKVLKAIKESIARDSGISGVSLPQSSMWDRKFFAPGSKSRFTNNSDIDLRLIAKDEEAFRRVSKRISDRIHAFDPGREVHFFKPLLTDSSDASNRETLADDYSVMTDIDPNVPKEVVISNSGDTNHIIETLYDGDAILVDSYQDNNTPDSNNGSDNKSVPESEPQNTVEELPGDRVKITLPDGSYVIGKRNEDGSVTPTKMHVPKGADRQSTRDGLRDEFYKWSQENGSTGVGGKLTKSESLRSNVRVHGDKLTLIDPKTGEEIGVSRASELISRGEPVNYKVDADAEDVPEDQRVPQSVKDARDALKEKDFKKFDELVEKMGPESPWSEKLQREGIAEGAKTHDVSPDMVNRRNRLRRQAEEWEKQKREEEEYRQKHPIRSRVQDIRETVNRGRPDTKIGKENPNKRWVETYKERAQNWQEGDEDWPTPPEPVPDDYVHPADAHYNRGPAENLPPNLVRNENGDLQYTTPDTGGWPTTHTPGEPWRPENSEGMAGRMDEITDDQWRKEGVQGLQRQDMLEEIIKEMIREEEERRKQREKEQKKLKEKREREKREREEEKKQRKRDEKRKPSENKPSQKTDKKTDRPKADGKEKQKPEDGNGKPKSQDDRKQPEQKTDRPDGQDDKRPKSDEPTSGDRPEKPTSDAPELPPLDDIDIDEGLNDPSLMDRVRQRLRERRDQRAENREGYESYDPRADEPGLGAKAGAALREKLIDWLKDNQDQLPSPSDVDESWVPDTSGLEQRIQDMSMSELRTVLQRAAIGSGNVDAFMQQEVPGTGGKTFKDYYEDIETAAQRERIQGEPGYVAPSNLSPETKQSIKDTAERAGGGNADPIERPPAPDRTSPTDRDAEAMQNIKDIIGNSGN